MSKNQHNYYNSQKKITFFFFFVKKQSSNSPNVFRCLNDLYELSIMSGVILWSNFALDKWRIFMNSKLIFGKKTYSSKLLSKDANDGNDYNYKKKQRPTRLMDVDVWQTHQFQRLPNNFVIEFDLWHWLLKCWLIISQKRRGPKGHWTTRCTPPSLPMPSKAIYFIQFISIYRSISMSDNTLHRHMILNWLGSILADSRDESTIHHMSFTHVHKKLLPNSQSDHNVTPEGLPKYRRG